MSPTVRRANVADIDELVRLREVMRTSLGGASTVPDEWADHAADDLRERLPEDDDLAVVVVDAPAGGGLVASAYGVIHRTLASPRRPDGRSGYVFGVVTEPDARGRGLGTAMMTELVAWFTARGVTSVELKASPFAERIYERLGFVRIEHPVYSLTITQPVSRSTLPVSRSTLPG